MLPRSPNPIATLQRNLMELATRVLSKYGLIVLLALLFVTYSILLPTTFPTVFNLRTILEENSIVLIFALALMMPLASGAFDLSVGYQIGLAQVLVIGLQVNQHYPWPIAILVTIGVGCAIGIVNGLIVTQLRIDSFIATLGSGAVIFGITLIYSGGVEIQGALPSAYLLLSGFGPLGIPVPAYVALAVCVILWIILEYLPIGRNLYVLGSNRRAAELVGITPTRYVPLIFAMCSLLCAIGAILLAAEIRVAQPTLGPEYLLPSFSSAILGTTAIRVGRVNPWGTAVAVFLIAIAVSGLLQLGATNAAQSIFNGGMLLVALTIAGITSRRRLFKTAAPEDAIEAPRAGEELAADEEALSGPPAG